VKFFLDNCLSPRYAQVLDILSSDDGHKVFHLRDRFARDVEDHDWITQLKKEGDWVIVSGDTRITKAPHLKAVWLDSKLTAFFLGKGWMNTRYWDQVTLLVRWWPTILETAARIETGTGFIVPYRTHRLEIIR
jgi:predicted nuclease of predicted toxin-antitoxin system